MTRKTLIIWKRNNNYIRISFKNGGKVCHIGLIEAQAYVFLIQFLTRNAAKQFRSARNGAPSRRAILWPKAAQSLLWTDGTPGAIREAVYTLLAS